MHGNPLHLAGRPVRVGETAPDFTALSNALAEVRLGDSRGLVRVLVTVPSLDTPVCDLEARRFNEEAARLGTQVRVLVVSMDLPFAQRRWCGAAGVSGVETLSDHRDACVGLAYGVLIKELRLLARAVFVIGKDDKLAYAEVVPEIVHEPDYAAVLAAVKELV
ncbi:MAG: putative thiol peroxidase [Lentisphaerae bacterium ADurb.BinA184]|nr:MAG: putative thiol peroxidase [Lentisphaerae bacterium ADurb.BinA184]